MGGGCPGAAHARLEGGVPPGVQAAAMSWHPDKNVGNEAHAAEKFKELQDASVVLGLKL